MKRSIAVIAMSAVLLTSYTTMQEQVSAASSTAQNVRIGHIENGVNLRDKPSVSSNVIGFLKKGSDVTILERSSDYFYKIHSQDGTVGYVSASDKYISVGGSVRVPDGGGQGATGVVVYGVNLRNQPSTAGKILGMLDKGTKVSIIEKSNDYFYKVLTESGTSGYVSTSEKYLETSGNVSGSAPPPAPNPAPAPVPSPGNSNQSKIAQVIEAGKKYLGTPYEFGSDRGNTATFDCSDLVRQAYRDALGIVLPADSRKQGTWIRDNGTAVYDIGGLKAGDLVFFMSYKGYSASAYQGVDPNSERITHVAIYLGGGQLLHTYSSKSGGVRIDKLDGSWEHRFLYGGSVLK
ncbi:cell wall-associated NlpC family hydrolase [Fontibacillus phaseoli]|uniref:Cell wall-associated NlpC family hydrolase n=1 Tax=Fontibacillus phaseoli TaxID=1416533 RepID=A0A369B0H8_9BACL|nr:SH3 domain-containing C40 family peptidase [Fontibacillus phaseoli]RCX13937.1 cell wall-associated NlpC family hydrolase [Fontibacillus phaseoli]